MALRVLGLGDNVVDQYLDAGMGYPGGQALNFAVYAKMAGAIPGYLGVFGTDENASQVKAAAEKIGVETHRCRTVEGENGYACVTHQAGERVFLRSNRGGVSRLSPLVLTEEDIRYIKTFDHLHMSVNGWADHELPTLSQTGVPISYDFSNKLTDENLRPVCRWLQYAVISCGHLDFSETEEMIRRCHDWGANHVLATRGGEGALFSDGERLWYQPALGATVVDTLGAGDAFFAAFLTHRLIMMGRRRGPANEEETGAEVMAAMAAGARLAAKIVSVTGAFGHGRPLRDEFPGKDPPEGT